MSDAATPSRAPAGRLDEAAESVINKLLAEDAAAAAVESADTAAPSVSEPPAEAPASADPTPGDQSQEPAPEPEPEPPPQTFRVKVRGEEREVTLDELRNGYSRTEDYKAKTAEVAEQRRALERDKAELTARASKLDQLAAQAPFDPVLAEGQKTDWVKLAQEDPASYVQKKAAFEQRAAFWQQVDAERQTAAMQAHQQRLATAEDTLASKLPEWKDTAKRQALVRDVTSTLESYGYSADEISGLADPRVIMVMRDLLQAKAAQSARQSAEAKRTTAAPTRVMQPGAARDTKAPNAAAQALLQKARQSNRLDDQVNAALAILGT
jgi:hypothetical protein